MLVPGAVGLTGSEVATGLLASLLFSQNPRNLIFDVAPFDAATLVHGIVSNHGFSDGNKRTALYLVELLVQRSGYEFIEDDELVVETITTVARGELDYEGLAEWFRRRLVRPKG